MERVMRGIMKKVECPCCNGDGKETCHNPDHRFSWMVGWGDVGRLGCPVCGHDPDHKVPDGGDCDLCDGTGEVDISVTDEFNKDIEY